MKRMIWMALAICILFCGCGSAAPGTEPTQTLTTAPSTQASTTQSTTQAVTVPSQPVTQPTTQPTQTEPTMLYQNPLNGEPMAEPYMGRPAAIMLNNHMQAMPQFGVGEADILYEVLAEGGITRCMGIYSDISSVERLCSIRSARKYYVDILRGYDAWYIHAGGSAEADAYMKNIGLNHLDGTIADCDYFKRDNDRLNAGYSSEHTLYTTGQWVVSGAAKKGFDLTRENADYGMIFDDKAVIVGQSAEKLTVYFNMGGKPGSYTKSTAFTYDPDTKLYSAAQHGGAYVDASTGKTVTFRNILVLRMATSVQSDGQLLTINTTGSGSGYFICNGQLVNIKWSRNSATQPFTYTLENGTPITFGVGSTYIGVVPTNATIVFE